MQGAGATSCLSRQERRRAERQHRDKHHALVCGPPKMLRDRTKLPRNVGASTFARLKAIKRSRSGNWDRASPWVVSNKPTGGADAPQPLISRTTFKCLPERAMFHA